MSDGVTREEMERKIAEARQESKAESDKSFEAIEKLRDDYNKLKLSTTERFTRGDGKFDSQFRDLSGVTKQVNGAFDKISKLCKGQEDMGRDQKEDKKTKDWHVKWLWRVIAGILVILALKGILDVETILETWKSAKP